MKRRNILIALVLVLATSTAWAQGPNGSKDYYKAANGKKGQALKTAMYNIIKNPDVTSYDGLINAYKKTDMRSDGKLRDWYSNVTNYTWNDRNGNSSEGAGWNREHSVPQSWFKKSTPMVSDIVHVIPTDCYVNNRRSSYPFGETNGDIYKSENNYSKLGKSKISSFSGTVFEPNDEIKGDIARIYFYMVTCYEDKITSWRSNATASYVFSENAYPGLSDWTLNMMMKWSKNDPVDDVEIARNKAVYEVQKNRNPFVDYPGLEEYVWGSKKDQAFSYDNYDGTIPDDPDPDDPDPDDPDPDTPVSPITGDNVYCRVSTTADLESGLRYLMVYENSETEGLAYYTFGSKEGKPGSVTIENGKIDLKNASNHAEPLTFSKANGNWTILHGENYLSLTSDANALNQSTDASDASAQWTVSISDGIATIANAKYPARFIFYNVSAEIFRCYKSGQKEVALYKESQTATRLPELSGASVTSRPVYNLRGQQVKTTQLPKGVYIRDGKKYVVK